MDLLLAAGPQSLVGIDLSLESLSNASLSIGGVASFCASNALSLPLKDRSIDLVVSFETLEHVDPGESFLAELARVIAADGTIILSTPNALYSRPIGGKPRNPFHVREFTPDELEHVLKRFFSSVELRGQSVSRSYGVSPYWMLPEHLPSGAIARAKVLVWKLQNRLLPYGLKDRLSLALRKRHFNPRDSDFEFTDDLSSRSHVIVATCRL